jgi:EpsI family protein
VFFGLIMMIMFWIGGRWADRAARSAPAEPAPLQQPGLATPIPAVRASVLALLALLLLVLPSQWAAGLRDRAAPTLAAEALAGLAPQGGWQQASRNEVWAPVFMGQPQRLQTHWQAHAQPAVTLDLAFYPLQRGDDKAVNSMNQLVKAGDPYWSAQGSSQVVSPDGPQAQTRWRARQDSGGGSQYLARRIYWVDGRFTSSEREAKLLGLRQLVGGRGDAQAMLVIMTAAQGDGAARLDAFWRDIRTPLNERLQALATEAAGHNARR